MGLIIWITLLVCATAVIFSPLKETVFKGIPKYKLAIGILSARQNFVERDVIRSTWSTVINSKNLSEEVFYSFVLTNKDCEVPTQYRRSVYECREPNFQGNDSPLDLSGVGPHCGHKQYPIKSISIGYDFQVTFDIVITAVAIPLEAGNDTVVQLWDLFADELVLESKLGEELSESCLRTRVVHPHLLPKGFVGSIVVHCGGQPCVGFDSWQDYYPYLAAEISPTIRLSRNIGEFPHIVIPTELDEMLLPALMVQEIADEEMWKNHVDQRPESYRERAEEILQLESALEEEMQTHQDIILVRDTDGKDLKEVYRNIPRKLVEFHHWCNENIQNEFLLKTDDDSYVDIEKILRIVDTVQKGQRAVAGGTWVGNFRRDWVVDRWGKWAEHRYTANVYPAYACGAGNIMESSLSQFISTNRKNLQFYQGEDISVGIWLSGVNAKYIDDRRWICDNSCHDDMVVSTQHSPLQLSRMWQNKNLCGNPCTCEC